MRGRKPVGQAPKLERFESCAVNLPITNWLTVKPMLPNKPLGVARVNDRRAINGVFWVLFGPGPLAGPAQALRSLHPATLELCQSDALPHLTGPGNLFNPGAAPPRAPPFRRPLHVDR